jgi:HTH-type transcriptional regulator / antitoxin HigA
MTAALNKAEYMQLLDIALPRVINSKKEHAAMLAKAEELMIKTERSRAETELLKLIVSLIETWERQVSVPAEATPADVLKYLMEQRAHKPKDLAGIVDKSLLHNILNGSRDISKELAKKLAVFYDVSPAVFI